MMAQLQIYYGVSTAGQFSSDATAYLQAVALRGWQVSVLASNPVEWVVVLSVMTLIKHLQHPGQKLCRTLDKWRALELHQQC